MASKQVQVAPPIPDRSRVVSNVATEHSQFMRDEAQRTSRDIGRVFSDLAEGRPPTTENLTTAIDRADKILLREEQMNPAVLQNEKVRQTVRDTHEFLEASKNLLIHKTGDNKFQTFLLDSYRASSDLTSQSSALLSAGGEETEQVRQMRAHFASVVDHSRKVLIELSTSAEFRQFITTSADIIARLLDMPVSFGAAKATSVSSRGSVEDTASHLRATTAQTQRLAQEEARSRAASTTSTASGVRAMELAESEGLVYEETDFEIHAARLADIDLPADYSPTVSDPSATTYVTSGTNRTEHFLTAGRGPIADKDPNAPHLKVVEKVYLPGQRVLPGSSTGERLSSSTSVVRESVTASTSSRSSESEAQRSRSAPMESASTVMNAVQQMWLENVDKDARLRIQTDFFALLSKLSAHPDHKQAIESLFALAGLIWQATPSAESISLPPALRQATADGKAVLGSFSGGEQNIDRLVTHLQAFALRVQNDPEVERILRKMGKYILRGLDNPALLQEAFFRQKIFNLLDRAGFLGEKYANDADLKEALLAWNLIIANITNDQDINSFGRALLKLRDDVSYIDPAGTRRVDFDTLSRLRMVVLPLLVEQLHYIPLPVIAGDTPDLSYRLEDMVISFYDLLPEHIFVDTETHSDFKPMSDFEHEYIDKTLEGGHLFSEEGEHGTRKAYNRHHAWGYFSGRRAKKRNAKLRPTEKIAPHLTADKKSSTYGSSVALEPDLHHRSAAQMVIRAYNIQFAIKNMKFDILRKKFPKVHAKGLADVFTQGSKGSKVAIRLDMAMDAYQANPFTGAAVAVKIAPLKVKIHNSKHDLFYTTMSNMLAGTIRKRAEAAIAQRMQGMVRNLLESMNGLFASSVGQLPGFSIAKPGLSSSTAMPSKIVSQH